MLMELGKLRMLAAKTFGVGKARIRFANPEKAADAITREDVRGLLAQGHIEIRPAQGTSRVRARMVHEAKKRGRRRGRGSRRGSAKARQGGKSAWMAKVRAQRALLQKHRPVNYRELYAKVKGGYFKSLKHLEAAMKKE
jgi:large subunit ribosomal protein L19e